MQDKWNIDTLMSEAARQDNCALPFVQWKAELLSAAKEERESRREAETQEAPPLTDELSERRTRTLQRLRTFRKNITWGFATAAAVLIVVLAANSSRLGMGRTGSAPAAPRAMPQEVQREELGTAPSVADNTEAGVAGAAGAEESIQAEIYSADDAAVDQNTAGIEAASLLPDENAALAIEAVEAVLVREALATAGAPTAPPPHPTAASASNGAVPAATAAPHASEGPDNDRGGGEYSGSAPIATVTLVSGQTYRIRTVSGEEADVTPEAAYVVGYEENAVRYLVDAQSMEVLGEILG